MGCNLVRRRATWNSGTTDYQWNIYILFVTALLSGWQSMLPNMIPVVASVDQVCVVQDTIILETFNDYFDKLINGLKSAESRAVEFIVVFDLSLILLR